MDNSKVYSIPEQFLTDEQQTEIVKKFQEQSPLKDTNNGMSKFQQDVHKFNVMYRLPKADYPGFQALSEDTNTRLKNFKETILAEVKEVDDIFVMPEDTRLDKINKLTAIADWLVDMQVYAASEMAKFGLDNDIVQGIVMQSNFSKNNPDGTTTYDDKGKVQKGPNYWKPEPKISEYISLERSKHTIPGDNRHHISHSRDGRQTTSYVTLEVTHDKGLKDLAEFIASRAYTVDKVTDVKVVTYSTSGTEEAQAAK